MSSSVKRGRLIVLVIVSAWLLLSVTAVVARIATGTLQAHPGIVSSLFLTIGLAYYLWLGYAWAKWAMAVFSGSGALLGAIMLLFRGEGVPPVRVALVLALIAYCLAVALVLVFSRDVHEFLAAQRASASPPEQG